MSVRLTPTTVAERELARCDERLTRLRADLAAAEGGPRPLGHRARRRSTGTNQPHDDHIEELKPCPDYEALRGE